MILITYLKLYVQYCGYLKMKSYLFELTNIAHIGNLLKPNFILWESVIKKHQTREPQCLSCITRHFCCVKLNCDIYYTFCSQWHGPSFSHRCVQQYDWKQCIYQETHVPCCFSANGLCMCLVKVYQYLYLLIYVASGLN